MWDGDRRIVRTVSPSVFTVILWGTEFSEARDRVRRHSVVSVVDQQRPTSTTTPLSFPGADSGSDVRDTTGTDQDSVSVSVSRT